MTERRVGQTWRYLQDGGSAFTLGERADVRRSGGKSDEVWEDTSGRKWFGWGQDGFFALIADAPVVAPLACARCKPTPQPAPAKAIRCIGVAAISTHECRGPNLVRMVGAIRGVMCERWMMTLEAKASDWTPNSGLAPYAGPERLSKPPMAHSYGVECPALEDA